MSVRIDLGLVSPPVMAQAEMERHRPWLECVLGCALPDAVTLQLDLWLGELVGRRLLPGVAFADGPGTPGSAFRDAVLRCSFPPDVSPVVELSPARGRGALIGASEPAWQVRATHTPVAFWLRELAHGLAAVSLTYVAFRHGPFEEHRTWVLANRAEVARALELLRRLIVEPGRRLRVIGGRDLLLGEAAYDWGSVVLERGLTRQVQDDFEGFLARETWFRRRRLPYRRGYLLHGPPGNGKTSVIRVMAAHPALSAFTLDFSNEELQNDAMTELFETAGHCAPSLVIFEDLDRVYGKMESDDNRTRITLPHLLNCLDGLGSPEGVIVVATANDARALDPAILRRPGRFDRVVPFRPPALELRLEHLRRLGLASLDNPRLFAAAEAAEGFSFAQIREAYIVAGQLALGRDGEEIGWDDLMEGIRLVRAEEQIAGTRPDGLALGFLPARRGDTF